VHCSHTSAQILPCLTLLPLLASRFAFVNTEKQARLEVEEAVGQLLEEMQELRDGTAEQVGVCPGVTVDTSVSASSAAYLVSTLSDALLLRVLTNAPAPFLLDHLPSPLA